MEEQGIDPCAFCMQSRRSTIWATPPQLQKKYIRWGSNSRQQSWPELESGALTTRPQMLYKKKCSMRGSNPRLLAHKTNTLPTELMELLEWKKKGRARVEPATYRAATDCSTTELTPHNE